MANAKQVKFARQDLEGTKKFIDSIRIDSAKMSTRVQVAAINTLLHVAEHRDERMAQSLYDAMGKGMRRANIAKWFEACSLGLLHIVDGEIKLNAGVKVNLTAFIDVNGDHTAHFERVLATNWETIKPEPKLEALDVRKMLDRMIKQVTDAQNESDPKKQREIKDVELLTVVQNALDAHYRDAM
jgi:hypothetical protein